MLECGMVSSGSGQDPLASFYGYGDELPDSIKVGSLLVDEALASEGAVRVNA